MSAPTSPPAIGTRVKFTADGRRWWDVRAANARYAICTRQAEFHPAGTLTYTVIDIAEGIRGTVEQRRALGNWDLVGDLTDSDCTATVDRLTDGALEISRGNRVPLDLAVPA